MKKWSCFNSVYNLENMLKPHFLTSRFCEMKNKTPFSKKRSFLYSLKLTAQQTRTHYPFVTTLCLLFYGLTIPNVLLVETVDVIHQSGCFQPPFLPIFNDLLVHQILLKFSGILHMHMVYWYLKIQTFSFETVDFVAFPISVFLHKNFNRT